MCTLNAQKRTNNKTIVILCFAFFHLLSFSLYRRVPAQQTDICTIRHLVYIFAPVRNRRVHAQQTDICTIRHLVYIFAPVRNYLHIVYTAVVIVFFEIHLGLEQ